MEEEREFKHVCKFCSKSFPCGRSLGGHMRSHMINDISAQTDGTIVTRKKLPALNNNCGANSINTGTEASAYGLRANRRRTWKFADRSSRHNSHFDNFCKECGKVFQSWTALFGHMKCHSQEKERLSTNNSLEELQDSWTSGNNQKMVMDSQSDNEIATPNQKRRSKRRIRYMGTANSSSLSIPNNSPSSASEIEQELEDVALCLIMLSRDVGQSGGLNSGTESSDNDSVFMETNRVNSKAEVSICDTNFIETKKSTALVDKKFQIGKSELSASKIFGKGSIKDDRVNKSQLSLDDQSGVQLGKNSIKQPGLNQVKMAPSKCNPSKRKFEDSFDPELRSDALKKPSSNDLVDSEVCKSSDKTSKFECVTCNKVFHSYQALGGHRASHKKINCSASKIDSSDNSIETELSPDPIADSKLIKPTNNGVITIDFLTTECDNKAEMSNGGKKSKGHECPVCLKVFPSGQALGGHKRSHLVGETEAKNSQTSTTQEPNPAIRDFLDLNLPAPGEEDSNGLVGFSSWWIGSRHKREAFVGLISN